MGAYFGMGNHTLSSIDSADSPSIDGEQNPGQPAWILTPTLQTITAPKNVLQVKSTTCKVPGGGTEGQKWSFYREQSVS